MNMKQLIIISSPNSSSRITVEKLGPLDTYGSVKTPYFYVNGDHSSLALIYQGDSTRKYEFDGVVYDPKSTSDFMSLYSALKFYLLVGGVL